MTTDVVTVGPDTPVPEIARTLLDRRISAVPVVNKTGRVLGIVSEGDLMRRVENGTERHRSWWLRLIQSPEERTLDYIKSHGRLARQVMTAPVISAREDMSLNDVACLLETKRIKRVPVIRDGKLVGIVSRSDLLNGLVSAVVRSPVARPDAELRDAILREFTTAAGVRQAMISVIVAEGVAHLWGIAENEAERQAAAVAADGVEGVRGVENHLALLPNHVRVVLGVE